MKVTLTLKGHELAGLRVASQLTGKTPEELVKRLVSSQLGSQDPQDDEEPAPRVPRTGRLKRVSKRVRAPEKRQQDRETMVKLIQQSPNKELPSTLLARRMGSDLHQIRHDGIALVEEGRLKQEVRGRVTYWGIA